MIREFLRKAFPISKTQKERREIIGWVGRHIDVNYQASRTPARYLGLLAMAITYRVSTLVGGALLIFFTYLSFKGINPTPYVHAIYPPDHTLLPQSGIGGLYLYYYAKIMVPVIYTIVGGCFLLFLIHVKKGEYNIFEASTTLRYKEGRTFKNKLNITISFIIVLIAAEISVVIPHISFLAILAWIPPVFHLFVNFFPGWMLMYICMIAVNVSAAMALYASVIGIWSVVFLCSSDE